MINFIYVNQQMLDYIKIVCTTKTTKGTTRVPEISHLRAGNHSESMERKKQRRSTSRSMITTSQECSQHHNINVHNITGMITTSHSCDVVIMDLLVDRRCFFLSIDSLWFPALRCDISGTLVVPLVVFVVLESLLGVPIALFF